VSIIKFIKSLYIFSKNIIISIGMFIDKKAGETYCENCHHHCLVNLLIFEKYFILKKFR